MVRVRERTIPTERPPLVGEVIFFSYYCLVKGLEAKLEQCQSLHEFNIAYYDHHLRYYVYVSLCEFLNLSNLSGRIRP
jgi:hypothetical protein